MSVLSRVKSSSIYKKRLGHRHDLTPDMTAVYQVCDGLLRKKLYPNELREAVLILTLRGNSLAETARIIGCCDRTVSRHRRALHGEGRL